MTDWPLRKKYRTGKQYKAEPYSARTGQGKPGNPNAPKAPPVGFRYRRKGKSQGGWK